MTAVSGIALRRRHPEDGEDRGREAEAETLAHAQLQPAAGQLVGHRGVLGDPHRMFERERDDAGAEPDPVPGAHARPCGGRADRHNTSAR